MDGSFTRLTFFFIAGLSLQCKHVPSQSSEIKEIVQVKNLAEQSIPLKFPTLPRFQNEQELDEALEDFEIRREFGWNILADSLATPRTKILSWLDADDISHILKDILSRKKKWGRNDFTIKDLDLDQYLSPSNQQPPKIDYSAERPFTEVIEGHLSDDTRKYLAEKNFESLTLYSPSFVRHLLKNYHNILECEQKTKDRVQLEKKSIDEPWQPNKQICLDGPFPRDAHVARTFWQTVHLDETNLLTSYSSDLGNLASILFSPGGEWFDLSQDHYVEFGQQDGPRLEDFVHLQRDNKIYVMLAFHVLSRETKNGIWTTAWWHPNPVEDFGSDKEQYLVDVEDEAAKKRLRLFKMCNVSSFYQSQPTKSTTTSLAEIVRQIESNHDTFIRDSFSEPHPELLAKKATSWCANPYFELAPGQQRTNCIGCHQHAGSLISFEESFQVFDRYGHFGNAQQRVYSETDKIWALQSSFPVDFQEVVEALGFNL